MHRTLRAGLVGILLLAGTTVRGQGPVTGASAPAPGAISGIVLDATTSQPVRNAVVTLGGSSSPGTGSRLTDERGRFIFLGVAPGKEFTLRASKAGYFDPSGFVQGPRTFSLASGQWLADNRLELLREGSISGVVLDERGEPVVGVRVRVFVDVPIAGRTRPVSGPGATTDDRGVYRIPGLPQGRYIVVVPSVQHAVPAEASAGVIAGQSVAQAAKPGGGVLSERPTVNLASGQRLVIGSYVTPPPPDQSGRSQAYPITFHPNALTIAASTPIALGAGQQREGVDVQLRPVPTWRISGRVDGPPAIVAGIPLRLLSAGSEDLGIGSEAATTLVTADGRFTFLNVPAGRYTIEARPSWMEYDYPRGLGTANSGGGVPAAPGGLSRGGSGGTVAAAPPGTWYSYRRGDWDQTVWIRAEVDVADRDLADLTVSLQRTGRISGRIEWERTSPAPGPASPSASTAPRSQEEQRIAALRASMARVTIRADPAEGSSWLGMPTGTVSADDTFTLDGLLAGAYALRVGTPAGGGPVSLKSIVWKGTDYTYTPLDASAGLDATDVVVTLIDKTQTIAGNVADIPGDQDAAVIAFPVDPKQWRNYGLQPALIRTARVSDNGSYRLTLPAGDFYLVAVDQTQINAWVEPAFLEAAARTATRVSLAWGEAKTQGLRFTAIKR